MPPPPPGRAFWGAKGTLCAFSDPRATLRCSQQWSGTPPPPPRNGRRCPARSSCPSGGGAVKEAAVPGGAGGVVLPPPRGGIRKCRTTGDPAEPPVTVPIRHRNGHPRARAGGGLRPAQAAPRPPAPPGGLREAGSSRAAHAYSFPFLGPSPLPR